jgi:hypothetical protein
VGARKLALPIGAQPLVGAPGADAGFEHRIQRAFDSIKVSRNDSFRQFVRASPGRGVRSARKDETGCSKCFERSIE